MSTMTFMEKCLAGEVDLDEIGDFVGAWHEGAGPGLELREFLGMTKDEYALWVEQPQFLPAIVASHRFGLPLREAVRDPEAAPDVMKVIGPDEARAMRAWLRQSGRA